MRKVIIAVLAAIYLLDMTGSVRAEENLSKDQREQLWSNGFAAAAGLAEKRVCTTTSDKFSTQAVCHDELRYSEGPKGCCGEGSRGYALLYNFTATYDGNDLGITLRELSAKSPQASTPPSAGASISTAALSSLKRTSTVRGDDLNYRRQRRLPSYYLRK